MATMIIKEVTQDEVSELMASNFLVEASKDILNNILCMEEVKINKELFDQYVSEYEEKYIYYQILKQKISGKYTADIQTRVLDWEIDFGSRIMRIEVED